MAARKSSLIWVLEKNYSLREQRAQARIVIALARRLSCGLRTVSRDLRAFRIFATPRKHLASPIRLECLRPDPRVPFYDAVLSELNGTTEMLVIHLTRQRKLPHELLKMVRVPVLLLRSSKPPQAFNRFIVPMSGETRANDALEWAIRRGSCLGIPVDVVHVTSEALPVPGNSTVESITDQFHHEYAYQVDDFICRAAPYASRSERSAIRAFRHRVGDPSELILAEAEKSGPAILILEWAGSLEPGRARLIKKLLSATDLPILLVRKKAHDWSRLRVESEFEDAA